MKLICAPNGFVDIRYPRQGILDITGAGFLDGVLDLSLCYPPNLLEKNSVEIETGTFEARAEKLIQAYKEQNLEFHLAIAPYLLSDTKRNDLNDVLEQLAVCCIRLCGKYSCCKLIVPPPFLPEFRTKSYGQSIRRII